MARSRASLSGRFCYGWCHRFARIGVRAIGGEEMTAEGTALIVYRDVMIVLTTAAVVVPLVSA